ncbi:MAG: DUF1285 domain-containing protein [Polyangiales bacterium]
MDPTPPFRFTRESRIVIDRDGHVFHEGLRVAHPRLEEALLSWVDWDDATSRWVLRNALDWCFVTVEHTPLAVRAVDASPDSDVVTLTLSDGTREALDPDTLRVELDGVVYARVKNGRVPARFDRQPAFRLLSLAEGEGDDARLTLGGRDFPLRPTGPGDRGLDGGAAG